jgi:hypothetical protein
VIPPTLQTVQLRTHSLFAPYIDEDLQNRYVLDPGWLLYELYFQHVSRRWWDFGADAYVVRLALFDSPGITFDLSIFAEFQQTRSADS